MKLKYAIKYNGKLYPDGEYTGGLPKKVEQDFIDQGYFEATGEQPEDAEPTVTEPEGSKSEPVDGLTMAELSAMKVGEITAVSSNLNQEELTELIALEEAKGDKARSTLIDHLQGLIQS